MGNAARRRDASTGARSGRGARAGSEWARSGVARRARRIPQGARRRVPEPMPARPARALYARSERYRHWALSLSARLGERDGNKEHGRLAALAQARDVEAACSAMYEHFMRPRATCSTPFAAPASRFRIGVRGRRRPQVAKGCSRRPRSEESLESPAGPARRALTGLRGVGSAPGRRRRLRLRPPCRSAHHTGRPADRRRRRRGAPRPWDRPHCAGPPASCGDCRGRRSDFGRNRAKCA